MAECVSGKDKVNLLFSLVIRVGKMGPSCCWLRKKNGSLFGNINNKCFIDQVCLVKMAGYRPASFFLAFLLILHLSGSINIQKQAWLILCYLELTLGLSKTNLYRHKTSWYRVTFEGQGNLPAAQVKTSNTCLLLQDLQWKWIIDKYLHDLIKS